MTTTEGTPMRFPTTKRIAVTGYADCTRVRQVFIVDSEPEFSAKVEEWAVRHGVTEWSRDQVGG